MKKKVILSALILALLAGCGGRMYAPVGILDPKGPENSPKPSGEPVVLEKVTPTAWCSGCWSWRRKRPPGAT